MVGFYGRDRVAGVRAIDVGEPVGDPNRFAGVVAVSGEP
jgi:hypothetical protein